MAKITELHVYFRTKRNTEPFFQTFQERTLLRLPSVQAALPH